MKTLSSTTLVLLLIGTVGLSTVSGQSIYDNVDTALTSGTKIVPEVRPSIPEIGIIAQPFNTGEFGAIGSVNVPTSRWGTPDGTISFAIWDSMGNLPGKKIADLGILNAIDLQDVGHPSSISKLPDLTFETLVSGLHQDSDYFLVMDGSDLASGVPSAGNSIVQGGLFNNSGTGDANELLFEINGELQTGDQIGLGSRWLQMAITPASNPAPFGGRPRYTQPWPLTEGVINKDFVTDNVSISGDGLTMYFNTVREESMTNADVWMATRATEQDEWSNARPVAGPINSQFRELGPDVTADGLELYFRRSETVADADQLFVGDYLMVSTRETPESDWPEPTRLPDSINELPCVSHPTVTGDGLELYFATASPEQGTEQCRGRNADVYVSTRSTRQDEWGAPALIEELAFTPGISPDGLELYFLEGARGSGSAPRAFVSTRQSRDEEFGSAVPLGSPPNDSSTNLAVWGPDLSSDGNTMYFTSDRPGTSTFFGAWQTELAEPCDINNDGSCNSDDLTSRSLFRVDLSTGSDRESHVLSYDISGDGRVDASDLEAWLSEAAKSNGLTSPYLVGDANLDGEVTFDDFLTLSAGFGGSGRNWSDGNFNGDGEVNFPDFLALSANFGQSSAAAMSVPEPSSLRLLSLAILVFTSRRQRKVTWAE